MSATKPENSAAGAQATVRGRGSSRVEFVVHGPARVQVVRQARSWCSKSAVLVILYHSLSNSKTLMLTYLTSHRNRILTS